MADRGAGAAVEGVGGEGGLTGTVARDADHFIIAGFDHLTVKPLRDSLPSEMRPRYDHDISDQQSFYWSRPIV